MNSNCVFVHGECSNCGFRLPDEFAGKDVKRNCAGQGPGVLRRSVNFANAAARHVAAGRPRTPEPIVAERFLICQGCSYYRAKTSTDGQCRHAKCGCNVKAVGLAGLNKLAWADQACPAGKWGRSDS